MRHGIPMAGNFLQQENVVLTGACEAIVVDVQCIFPALGPLSKCFHTKFITTSEIARMPSRLSAWRWRTSKTATRTWSTSPT